MADIDGQDRASSIHPENAGQPPSYSRGRYSHGRGGIDSHAIAFLGPVLKVVAGDDRRIIRPDVAVFDQITFIQTRVPIATAFDVARSRDFAATVGVTILAGRAVEAVIDDQAVIGEYAVDASWTGRPVDSLRACVQTLVEAKISEDGDPRQSAGLPNLGPLPKVRDHG